MSTLYRQPTKSTLNERDFCRALLNNENPIWDDNDVTKTRKRGCRLPPEDFVYGLKHPKQDGMTGVAAALRYYDNPTDILKSKTIPNFIAINKIAARLGLTKVPDLHQYRKTMNTHQIDLNPCCYACTKKKSISDIIHGRATGEQQSIRDLIENKYLHEWLHETAIRRCKKILANTPRKMVSTNVHEQKPKRKTNNSVCKQIQ